MPKISIVIPCFNSKNHLANCINALVNQTFKDFEVIFIDDCSTDGTYQYLISLNKEVDFRYKVLKNETNLGPACSRNRGIAIAQSEYITFCDSDDWYEYTFLEKMYNSLIDKGADIVFCGYIDNDGNGKLHSVYLCMENVILLGKDALLYNVDSLCMLMVKTNIMKTVIMPDIRYGEDMAVVPLLMLKSQKCVLLNLTLYNYLRRSNSASHQANDNTIDSYAKSFKFITDNIDCSSFPTEIEYLGVRNYLYPTLISIFTFSFNCRRARDIVNDFSYRYPQWHDNHNIYRLPMHKKLVLSFAHIKFFLGIKMLAIIRRILY